MLFLAGIPWLAGLIGSLWASVFTFVATFVTKRIAFVIAAIVILSAITATLFAALTALIAGLAVATPDFITQAASMALPSNTDDCIVAYMTARLARYGYDWNVRILQYKLF